MPLIDLAQLTTELPAFWKVEMHTACPGQTGDLEVVSVKAWEARHQSPLGL